MGHISWHFMQEVQRLFTILLNMPKRENKARSAPRGQRYLHQNLGVIQLSRSIVIKIIPVIRLIEKNG
jgi:hypothetical protein